MYKYKNLPLQPAIFKELLIELFDGKQFNRTAAIKTICEYHESHGGIMEKDRDYIRTFKSATRSLKENGIENVGYGVWRLTYEKTLINEVVDIKPDKIEYKVGKIIGSGDNSVYVYYYDTYKLLAEKQGEQVWPCKIGRTDRDPIQRVIGQAGTCFPELPYISLLIKCEDSNSLEQALHGVLKYKGKWLENAPGTEWYLTSPLEIEAIYCAMK